MAYANTDSASPSKETTVFRSAFFLSGTAVILSAATISYFNSAVSRIPLDQICGGAELAALTLMPYMISAAVAAITAIAVMALIPSVRYDGPSRLVQERLQSLASGDLKDKVAVKTAAPQMQALIADLNIATSTLGHEIATIKLINRQQWELLEAMREITVVHGQAQLVTIIEQMEKNWEKVAEIEDRLTT